MVLIALRSWRLSASIALVTGMKGGRCRRVATTEPLQLLSASGSVSTVRPSGTGASGSERRLGRPFLYDAPRARVSSWPPLRLARMRFERESVGVVCPPGSHIINLVEGGQSSGTQDRSGCASRVRADRGVGGRGGPPGRADRDDRRRRCGCSRTASGRTDEVAIEATCNTHAIVEADRAAGRAGGDLEPDEDACDRRGEGQDRQGRRRRSSRSCWRRTICRRCGSPIEATQALRRQVARRAHIVRQRTRLKNQVQAILHRNLIPRCPVADLFGIKGRCWLANQPLPPDEELAVEALLRQLDFHGQELRIIDAALGRIALERERGQAADDDPRRRRDRRAVDRRGGRRLPPVPPARAARLLSRPEPAGASSPAGSPPATGGSPSTVARTPAGCSSRPPGSRSRPPVRCARSMSAIRARRGMQIAVVATARKLAVLCWHDDQAARTTRSRAHR